MIPTVALDQCIFFDGDYNPDDLRVLYHTENETYFNFLAEGLPLDADSDKEGEYWHEDVKQATMFTQEVEHLATIFAEDLDNGELRPPDHWLMGRAIAERLKKGNILIVPIQLRLEDSDEFEGVTYFHWDPQFTLAEAW